MGYNAVLDKSFSAESATEPVSLTEAKQHLNMVFDTAGSYEFNDDDTYLTDTIKQARVMTENYTGRSLIERTVTAILRNDCGDIELPYGPVGTVSAIVDADDEAITDYKVQGLEFKWLQSPLSCYAKLTYTAGYTAATIPVDLKRAILEQIAFRYQNRGDQQQEFANADITLCKSAMEIAAPYKRTGFLV